MAKSSPVVVISFLVHFLVISSTIVHGDPKPDPAPSPSAITPAIVKITAPIVSAVKEKIAGKVPIAPIAHVAEKKMDKDPLDAQESAQYGARNTAGQQSYGGQSQSYGQSAAPAAGQGYGQENNGYQQPASPQPVYNAPAPVPSQRPPAPVNGYNSAVPPAQSYNQNGPAQGYGQAANGGQSYGQDDGDSGYGNGNEGSSDTGYENSGYGVDTSEDSGQEGDSGYGGSGGGGSGYGGDSGENGYSGASPSSGDEGLENSGADGPADSGYEDGNNNGGGQSYGGQDNGNNNNYQQGGDQGYQNSGTQSNYNNLGQQRNSNNNNYQSRPSTHLAPVHPAAPSSSYGNRPMAPPPQSPYPNNAVKSGQQQQQVYPANNSPANVPVSSHNNNYAPQSSSAPPPSPSSSPYSPASSLAHPPSAYGAQSSYPASDSSYGQQQSGHGQQSYPQQGTKSPPPPQHVPSKYPPPPAQSYNQGNKYSQQSDSYNNGPTEQQSYQQPAAPQSYQQSAAPQSYGPAPQSYQQPPTKSFYGNQLQPMVPQPQSYSQSSSAAPAYPSSGPTAQSYNQDTKSQPSSPPPAQSNYPDQGNSYQEGQGNKAGLPMSYGGFQPLGRKPQHQKQTMLLEIIKPGHSTNQNKYEVTVSEGLTKAPRAPQSYGAPASGYGSPSAGYEAAPPPPPSSGSKLYQGPGTSNHEQQSYQQPKLYSGPSYNDQQQLYQQPKSQSNSGGSQDPLSQYTSGAEGVYEGPPMTLPSYDGAKYELTSNPYLDSGDGGMSQDMESDLFSGYGQQQQSAAAAMSGYQNQRPKKSRRPQLAYPMSASMSNNGYESLAYSASSQPQTPTYPKPIELQYRTRSKGQNYLKSGYSLDYSGGLPYLGDFSRKPYSTKFKRPSLSSIMPSYGGHEAIDLALPMKLYRKPKLPLPVFPPPILHHGPVPKMPSAGHPGLPAGMAEYGLASSHSIQPLNPWSMPSMGLPKGFGSPIPKSGLISSPYEQIAAATSSAAHSMEMSKPFGGSMTLEEAKNILKSAGYNLDVLKPGPVAAEEATPSPEEVVKAQEASSDGDHKGSSSRLIPTIIKTRIDSLYKALSKNRSFFG